MMIVVNILWQSISILRSEHIMKKISFILMFYLIQTVASLTDVLKKFHQNKYVAKIERASVLAVDFTYLDTFEMKTFKYNRTQTVTNITMKFLKDVGDLNLSVESFKLNRNNAYRPFPIALTVSLCEALESNVLGLGTAAKKTKFTCPLKKNIRYHIGNFVADSTLSAPLIPTGDYRIAVQMLYGDINIAFFEMYEVIQSPILPTE